MTEYLTAAAAATRLGKSEKTIRRWIQEGRLQAHHPQGRKNLLAISEGDIEQLATELAKYAQPASEDISSLITRIEQIEEDVKFIKATVQGHGPDIGELEQKVSKLENKSVKLFRLLDRTPGQEIPGHDQDMTGQVEQSFKDYQAQAEQRIAALEQALARLGTPDGITASRKPIERATEPTVLPASIPIGSELHYQFAKHHGVPPRTFLDHIQKGHVPDIPRKKKNKPLENEHWLTQEQQQRAIDFWIENGTKFTKQPAIYPYLDYGISGNSPEHEIEDQGPASEPTEQEMKNSAS